MNKEKVGSFYDVVWTEYIPEYDASEKHWLLFFTPEEVKGKSVLDSGCGTGIFSIIFAKNGAGQVTGIDISPGSLGTAESLKQKFGLTNARFEQQDMLHLPYADASFDIVWAWGTVHHTTDPLGAIDGLIRVLKPGGSILLAIYKKTKVTWIHEIIRRTLIKTPRFSWNFLAKVMAFFGTPIVWIFKRREKARKGESLSSSSWTGTSCPSGTITSRTRSRRTWRVRASPSRIIWPTPAASTARPTSSSRPASRPDPAAPADRWRGQVSPPSDNIGRSDIPGINTFFGLSA